MEESSEGCEKIKAVVDQFDLRLHETGQVNDRSMRRMEGTNDRTFTSLAKLDHII